MVPDFVTKPDPLLYKTGSWVCLDFETSNLDKGSALNPDNRIVLACWSYGKGKHTYGKGHIWGSEFDMGPLLEVIEKTDFLIAQNAKFELQWLDRCGYDVGSKPVYDTMLAEWVLSGNRMWPLDLDSLAAKYGAPSKDKLVSYLIANGVSPEDIPRSVLLKYCYGDIDATRTVMLSQLEAMKGTRLLPIVYTRCLVTLALSDIEKAGIFLDSEAVEQEYEKTAAEFNALNAELATLSGGINMNSDKQLAEFLYSTLGFKELCDPKSGEVIQTAGGKPKTDVSTLARLEATTEEQRHFLELTQRQGKLSAALSKNLEFFRGVCQEYGGVFYGQLRQGAARTHRLASSGRRLKFKMYKKAKSCQFQNLPNQYKRLIKARNPGWLLAEADGAQLEFRVGGHLGNDDQIKDDVRNKADIHSATRDVLVAAGEPDLIKAPVKMRRRLAKASTFKPMYGGTKGSDAVEAYCKFFAKKYNQLNTTQENWARAAANDKMIETEWGMRYYFPDVKLNKWGYVIGKQKVFNYPIQGLATAEIIPIGLVFFWYRTKGLELIINNTVHDSIVCEVPPHEIELFMKASVKALTTDTYKYLEKCYGIKFSLPLGVSMKLGTHWGVTAFTDEELKALSAVWRKGGYEPEVEDGEVAIDVQVG